MKTQIHVALKHVAGIASHLPWLYSWLKRSELLGAAGSTSSACYCYNVFWRHVQRAEELGLTPVVAGSSVLELGPGGSLGTGLCALLAGADQYTAVDLVPFAANLQRNLMVLEELISLFEAEAPLAANESIWPNVSRRDFPALRIRQCRRMGLLATERLKSIRTAMSEGSCGVIRLEYCRPSALDDARREGTLDWIFSQAVLEHVEDVARVYATITRLLRKGGCTTHTIDFKAHGMSRYDNGHYRYSERVWRLLVGRRILLSNRRPPSAHVAMIARAGMRVLANEMREVKRRLPKTRFHKQFRNVSDQDAYTGSSFLVAVK